MKEGNERNDDTGLLVHSALVFQGEVRELAELEEEIRGLVKSKASVKIVYKTIKAEKLWITRGERKSEAVPA